MIAWATKYWNWRPKIKTGRQFGRRVILSWRKLKTGIIFPFCCGFVVPHIRFTFVLESYENLYIISNSPLICCHLTGQIKPLRDLVHHQRHWASGGVKGSNFIAYKDLFLFWIFTVYQEILIRQVHVFILSLFGLLFD